MAIRCDKIFSDAQPLAARPWVRTLLFAILATVLSACSLATQEIETPLDVPAQFSDPGSSPLPDRWWLSFEDSVLNGLIDQALANNFSLKTAWDRLNQVEALARKAGADLFPSLDAEADTSRNRLREDGGTNDSNGYGLGLAAGYELDLWGRIRSSRDAAVWDAKASMEDLRSAALSLSAQVSGTWYQLVEQYGQLNVLEAQIVINGQILDLVTLQFRTGQVGIADMLQQRQLVESNRGEKTQVMARIKIFRHQLAILLGTSPGQSTIPQISALPDLPLMPHTGLPAELIRRRPDIRSAYYSIQSADSDLAAAAAERFPRLSLTAQVDFSAGHTRDLFNNWLATLAANLVSPIVDGGLRKAEVDRNRAVASEKLHTYGQTILDALGEVEDALVKEHRQRDLIASLNIQLKLAGQVIERIRDRYMQGTVDYQRVLDALLSQQELQRSLLTAQRDLVQYRIDLCRSLAGGWEVASPEPDPPGDSATAGKNAPSRDRKAPGRGAKNKGENHAA